MAKTKKGHGNGVNVWLRCLSFLMKIKIGNKLLQNSWRSSHFRQSSTKLQTVIIQQ